MRRIAMKPSLAIRFQRSLQKLRTQLKGSALLLIAVFATIAFAGIASIAWMLYTAIADF